MKNLINGITKENPLFVLMLGMCPALAVTTKFENAYMLGLCVIFVLVCSNVIVSLIKKIVPNSIKIPTYILIIGTFVTLTEVVLKENVPILYNTLGIYLPLIVVNCIVLGRALSVASKQNVKNSFFDGLGIGIGYTLAISAIALIREVLGTNTITIVASISELVGFKAIFQVIPNCDLFPMSFLVTPAGAFLTLGITLGIIKSFSKEVTK